jgi:hypothetical protein
MVGPDLAEKVEGGDGERDVALFAAFSGDVQQHTFGVDVLDTEVKAFGESQSAGVDGGQTTSIEIATHAVEDLPDLVSSEDDGKLLASLWPRDIEGVNGSIQDTTVEEADAGQSDAERSSSRLLLGSEVDEIGSDLLIAQLLGR